MIDFGIEKCLLDIDQWLLLSSIEKLMQENYVSCDPCLSILSISSLPTTNNFSINEAFSSIICIFILQMSKLSISQNNRRNIIEH